MCTAAEPASHGHEARAGAGRNGSSSTAISPQPAATA
jgi:hypothetical protein